MANNIILVGGGGHCRSCIDIIEVSGKYNILGIIDPHINTEIFGYNILGDDSSIPAFTRDENISFLVSVGHIKFPTLRKRIFNLIFNAGGIFATIISPFALVSRKSTIQEGSIVCHNAIVNTSAQVGKNVILNTKSIIEHDCLIGDHCHISTGTIINGGCTIGNDVLVGSNSVVIQGIHIVSNVVVGAGSVVIRDINEPGIYAGNPVKKISDIIG